MISITICKQDDRYVEVKSKGHAEYDDSGMDIVCAAVSMIMINTVNSIDTLTEDDYYVEEGDNQLDFGFDNPLSEKAQVLMDSLVLGLQTVKQNYGNEYMKLIFKEV